MRPRTFFVLMALLFAFGVGSLFWMPHSTPDAWRPSIRVDHSIWSQSCVGDVIIGRCVFSTSCIEHRGPSIVIDGTWYPAGKPVKWELTPEDVKGCQP